jgi:hypothetical protein
MNVGTTFLEVATKVARPQEKLKAERRHAEDRSILNDFMARHAELLASFSQSRREVFQKLGTYSQLLDITNMPSTLPPGVTHRQRADQFGDEALLTLIDRGVLTFAIETAESKAALDNLRRSVEASGLRPPTTHPPAVAVATAEADQPTEADLDQAAIQEFRTTSTSDVKRHMKSDAAFNARINRLMSENRI